LRIRLSFASTANIGSSSTATQAKWIALSCRRMMLTLTTKAIGSSPSYSLNDGSILHEQSQLFNTVNADLDENKPVIRCFDKSSH
jgi:hypothetical protein